MEIRRFQPQDATQIAQLFHDTVRSVNIQDYALAQVQAWAPEDIYFRDWVQVCTSRFTYVAEGAGIILGFAELEVNGHIGCFYCHRDYQRRGVGRNLFEAIKLKAKEIGCDRLYTEVSITAQPFFHSQGFTTVQAQEVIVRGARFKNYCMEKYL